MTTSLQQLTAQRDFYRSHLHNLLVRHAATNAIAKFGGRTAFLLPLLERQLGVREDGDKFTIFVVDAASGSERPGMSIDDVLAAMRADTETTLAFDARHNTETKLSNNPWSRQTLNVTQQALLLQRNPGLAARMRREAEAS